MPLKLMRMIGQRQNSSIMQSKPMNARETSFLAATMFFMEGLDAIGKDNT